MQGLLAKPGRRAGILAADRKGPSRNPQERLLRGYLHKTSNSLCGIKGYASLIAGLGCQAADNARWAQKIILEIENMERIFQSVGDLASLQTQPAEPATLPEVLDQAWQAAVEAHPNLEILCGRIPAGQPLLPPADLGMVLREIFKNSAEGHDDTGVRTSVTIACTRAANGMLELRLQDDGPGIAAELLAQVREPFVTTKPGHLGIGLTRVDTVMDMYGLAWSLTSAPGQGSLVTLEAAAPGRES